MADHETYFDRGREFYTITNNPVWPGRHRELPDQTPGHPIKGELAEDGYVRLLLNRLDNLERKTRPSTGEESAKGKDLAAFSALEIAGELTEHVAGWAIDHEVGLAVEGLKFVPLQPSGTKSNPQYLSDRATVDSHAHEKIGSLAPLGEAGAFFARKCLTNLLRCNPGAMPEWLRSMTIEGLEALDYGEVQPMFLPLNEGRKRELTALKLQLRVIAMVAYRRKLGLRRQKALEEVGGALSVAPNTILSWVQRLRNEFGRLEVDRIIAFAENHASWVAAAREHALRGEPAENIEVHEAFYGDAALIDLKSKLKAAMGD